MDDRLRALDALIEAVEANGSIWPGHLDGTGLVPHTENFGKAYNGSLDAAKALHDALLPGWGWKIEVQGPLAFAWVGKPDEMLFRHHNSSWENPARAWLLAFLRAHRAQIAGE